MSVAFIKVLTEVKKYKTRGGDKLLRGMVAYKGEDIPVPMVAPESFESHIAKDRCLTISKVKKGTNTLTVTSQSCVSIL